MNVRLALFPLWILATATPASTGFAQPPQTGEPLTRSTARAAGQQQFELQYKAREGETIRWQVEQIASTETRMAGHEETSSLRSRSVHSWTIERIDSHGNITFQNRLESAAEWQKVGKEEAISFDSQSDDPVPDIFQPTAEKIGKPIGTITIDAQGQVVNRVDHITTAELGMGSVAIPLPAGAVAIGAQWESTEEVQARRKDKSLKSIKTRIVYTLREVADGTATISFRREVLTPIDDPWIEMQLQQKINQGSILFDIARGRIVRKLVRWDEQVQGFEGSDSFLRYLGNYTMSLLEAEPTESINEAPGLQPLTPAPVNRSSSYVKPRDGAPVIRR